MELVKKIILQATTTGITTGCTGSCFVIIPDIDAIYNMKILLTSDTPDLGFFTAFEQKKLEFIDVIAEDYDSTKFSDYDEELFEITIPNDE